MATINHKFPLLNEIDQHINSDNIDWNKNAFETLLTSNLPELTINFYAVDVGLRRLENSFSENYWDATAEALHDLSKYLLKIPVNAELDAYLYEAKCQLLMFTSIALLKRNKIRHLSALDAKMACATVSLLLLEQSKPFEIVSANKDYASCIRSMRSRYFKRIFLIGQWLPTLPQAQIDEIQTHYERYISTMIDSLFTAISIRQKFHEFIEHCLLGNDHSDSEAVSSGFVVIRRFPKYNEKTITKHSDLMHIGLVATLREANHNHLRSLICSIWTLCCMIEADRVSLGILKNHFLRDHFSTEPIDFEQKPITMDSLNEQDLMVFLLLCAQQHQGDKALTPYSLYSSSWFCFPNQKNWWINALDHKTSAEFLEHLATIRLSEGEESRFPPNRILLQTARILFKAAQKDYEEYSRRTASSYEQYAIQYLETAKKQRNQTSSAVSPKVASTRPFFTFPVMKASDVTDDDLLRDCERISRQCDEFKSLPDTDFPSTSDSSEVRNEYPGFLRPFIVSPTYLDDEEEFDDEPLDSEILPPVEPTVFITPPANKSRDVDVQTVEVFPPQPMIESPPEETDEPVTPSPSPSPPPAAAAAAAPSYPPFVDMIFSHMNGVNQWINRFYVSHEGIQSDVNTIRDRLEKLNRATSEMLYNNVNIFQTNPTDDSTE